MAGNFIQDDLDLFLETSDFGVSVTWTPQPSGTGTTFDAIFDDTQELYDVSTGSFISSSPQILCKTVSVSGISNNDLVQVSGISNSYYVQKTTADGTGFSLVYLSKGKV